MVFDNDDEKPCEFIWVLTMMVENHNYEFIWFLRLQHIFFLP